MKAPAFTKQFDRDIKICQKRKKDLTQIKAVMFDLIIENELLPKYNDHRLVGNYQGHRECHIESDWLLIYLYTLYTGNEIRFVRTGSHSDLF